MPTTKSKLDRLPGRYANLMAFMPPQAISDDAQHTVFVEVIDRLMKMRQLTKGQKLYLETLVQLVEAYEQEHYLVETEHLDSTELLKHLLESHGMNGSDLARLLGVHVSMGSKLLSGKRSLTIEHLRKLAEHFSVEPQLFL